MRSLRIVLFIAAIAALAAGYLILGQSRVELDEKTQLRLILPDEQFADKSGMPPHFLSGKGSVAFNSYEITPNIRGYAGPIKTLLVLTSNGTISGIRILGHQETRNYVHYMESEDYLRRFIGKKVTDPFDVGKDVDAISRATVSVEALAKTVRESSALAASNLLGIEVKRESAGSAGLTAAFFYTGVFSVGLWCYFLTRRSKKVLVARDVMLGISVPLIGFYLSTPFSVLHVFNIFLGRPALSSPLWWAVLGSLVISVLVAGRFYCGWLCPFGALSEFIGRVPLRKWTIPAGTDGKWREAKFLLLGISAVIVFLTRRPELGSYEPYLTLFSFHGNLPAWFLAILLLALNLRIPRFWCRYLCPVAALLGLISRDDPGYTVREACPVGNGPAAGKSECIRCNRCFVRVSSNQGRRE